MACLELLDLQTRCMEVVVERLADLTSINPASRRLEFRSTPGFSLHYLADDFLQMLQRKGKLSDVTLSLFHNAPGCVTSCLQRVRINGTGPALLPRAAWGPALTLRGLEVLQTHSLTELELVQVRGVRVDLLLKRLPTHSLHTLHLQRLEMGAVTASVVCRFPKLRHLGLVGAGLCDADVMTLATARLPLLDSLDLSSNGNITSLLPLLAYCPQLRWLAVRDCMLEEDLCLPVLQQMAQLQHLDVLLQSPSHASYAERHTWFYYVSRRDHVRKLRGQGVLELTDCLPRLLFLDISGRGPVPPALLGRFLQDHPGLRCLGLVNTELGQAEASWGPPTPRLPPLTVLGDGREDHLLDALRRYVRLDVFVPELLARLPGFAPRLPHREEAVTLVLQAMTGRQVRESMDTFHLAVLALLHLLPLHPHGLHPVSPALLARAAHLTLATWRPFRAHTFQVASSNSLKQHALGDSVNVFLARLPAQR